MVKNFIILVLLAWTLLLTTTLIRLEDFHYATKLGMCSTLKSDELMRSLERHDCLHRAGTRTSGLWHLYYALLGE